MFCSSCGSKMEAGIKFCGSCGSKTASAVNLTAAPQEGQAAALNASVPKEKEYITKAKDQGKQFYSFAVQTLKKPFHQSRKIGEEQKVNGILTLGLIALLLPLFTYIMLNNMQSGFGSYVSSYIDIPFGEVVLQPFFLIALFIGVHGAVHYGVARMMKVDVNYMTVLAKYGAFSVIPLGGLIIANLLMLVSASGLALLFFLASSGIFILSGISLLFSLHSLKKTENGLDIFYGLVITNAVMIVFYLWIGSSIAERIQEQFTGGLFGF